MNTSDTTTAPRRPARAWPLENALVSAALAAQRVSWIDAPARAIGLKPLTRQHLTRQVLAQLRRTSSGRPTRLRTAFGTFLMPLNADDATSLIGRADEAGARGDVTTLTAEGRRLRLTPHAALPVPLGTLRTQVRAAAEEEAAAIYAMRRRDGSLGRADWCTLTARLARRIVLGDGAADDSLVSAILEATAQAEDSTEYDARTAALRRRLAPYVHAEAPGGLVTSDLADDARDAVVEHALETVSRALTDTAPQALALVTVQPLMPATDRTERAVSEALRRYPPLAATVHTVCAPFVWHSLAVEAGTEILCATAWLRDLDEEQGRSGGDPSASLCAAPAPCSAAGLAVLAATELVRALTRIAEPVVLAPHLTLDALPADLPAASLRLAMEDTDHAPRDAAEPVIDGYVPPIVGQSPAHYAALAAADARSLEEHARKLVACARQSGWNHDAFGERCRMTLLAHAERCARAAGDARRAAEWLAN
ncbi:hypothetical protein [Streptomyces beijiangensis]|uniref:Uncharacterized protein n=1 Tax=Streptomyces beijiangensis TaxID=163361 RepID=A0A939JFE3_9ACTN|nr:hypothetical protein [Streptomyces beijiangensis]MBO0510422.1 hypothetical protein [Streptomyces beijiangensis]